MRSTLISLLLFSSLLVVPAGAQVGDETWATASQGQYPVDWPAGPSPDSVPAWAAPGRVRFARWDGGRIETAKSILSGLPGFNPPDPDRIEAMTNWYRPETVRLLQEAGVNLIWVTFSNGFSIETETRHQAEVRQYIAECHRAGIHVLAYESLTNMFWEDMFARVPESRDWVKMGRDGKPVPYGGGDYSKLGRITRYLADLGKPGWRNYLRRRIDLAIDAGADGVMLDNNVTDRLLDAYRDLYRYGARRKKDFLLMGNFHFKTYACNRLTNCLTTEDAFEPGIYAQTHAARLYANQKRYYGRSDRLLPVEGGLLVNNAGLFRIHQALSMGWKPAMIEYGPRETGERESEPISAAHHQLALAECQMYGISMELYVEGAFAEGLWNGQPEARRIWTAIGAYNRFFADNEKYYTHARSAARIAVVLDDRSVDVPLLNGLAARNILYDVLYERDLTPEELAPYAVAAVLTAATLRDTAIAALEGFVSRGGKLLATGEAGKYDGAGAPRPAPAVFTRGRFYETMPPVDDLAAALRAAAPPVLTLEAPPGVIANVAAQSENGRQRLVVHLLNYRPGAVHAIKVRLAGKFQNLLQLSPDPNGARARLLYSTDAETAAEVPELGIYSILAFEPSRTLP